MATSTAYAHAPIGPGDVAVVGVRQGSPDELVLVTLVALHEGDTIELTDDGMRADGTLRRAEGASFFEVVRTNYPAGSLITVPVGTMSLDRSADQVFLYRGTVDASGVLTGAWIWALAWGQPFGTDATSTRDSALPWPLAAAFTELSVGGQDMVYVGRTAGAASEVRAAIADASNWRVGPAGTLVFPTAPFDVRIDRGGPCGADPDCAVGDFCVEGTCCNTTCMRDVAGHCFGCYFAAGSPRNGTCGPAAVTQLCRIGRGICDPQETCDGLTTSCPPDRRAPSGTVCRTRRDACDAPEVCDGTTTLCPSDALEPSGHVCRAASSACDDVEVCDGAAMTCPPDLALPDGAACSASCGDAVCDMGRCGACAPDDAGLPPDAGVAPDAWIETDAGPPPVDAGPPDATVVRSDAGPHDAAFAPDAASVRDASFPRDAASSSDGSSPDAMRPDGGGVDGGPDLSASPSCACSASSPRPAPALAPMLGLAWWLLRRQRRGRRDARSRSVPQPRSR